MFFSYTICLLVKHWNLEGGREKERGHAIDIQQCTAVSGKNLREKALGWSFEGGVHRIWPGHKAMWFLLITSWLLFQVSEFLSHLDSYLWLRNARQGSKIGQKWLTARPGTTILQMHPLSNHQYHCLQEFRFTHSTTGKTSGWGCVTAEMLVPQAGNYVRLIKYKAVNVKIRLTMPKPKCRYQLLKKLK